MKRIFSLLKIFLPIITVLVIDSCGDNKNQTNSNFQWDGNNCYIFLKDPYQEDTRIARLFWRGDLSDLMNDIYKELNSSNKSGEIGLYVRFEYTKPEQFGNLNYGYEEFKITTIPTPEIKKYKNAKYLDDYYQITNTIRKAANGDFDTVPSIYIEPGFDI